MFTDSDRQEAMCGFFIDQLVFTTGAEFAVVPVLASNSWTSQVEVVQALIAN
jgi:hypothetical protein